jgi:hypothetical protein
VHFLTKGWPCQPFLIGLLGNIPARLPRLKEIERETGLLYSSGIIIDR